MIETNSQEKYMSSQHQPPSTPLPSQPEADSASGASRFPRFRIWLRSSTGRIVIPLVTLIVGIIVGIFAVLLFVLSSEVPKTVIHAPSSKGDILVEADRAFLTQLVTKNLHNSDLPGQIENVDLKLAQGNHMIISGDDVLSVLGIKVTRHFTFVVQPYVNSCVVQIHIVYADFSNIPVTGVAQGFESQINQQLQSRPEGLPSGFQYCATGVRTEPAGMFVTYSAIPM
jgi:hypothetical protein